MISPPPPLHLIAIVASQVVDKGLLYGKTGLERHDINIELYDIIYFEQIF